ncbi:MAG: DUF1801 domain-containing protein [Corynebacterium sp.]|nr:DUF1801 domain-containing protein [Corynebacterium sp.]
MNPIHKQWLDENIGPDDERYEFVDHILSWVTETYPQLECVIKWKQPMFLDHGVFILGLSVASKHVSLAPEGQIIERFGEKLKAAGYNPGKKFFRIPFGTEPDFGLIGEIIDTNIAEKANATAFWR